MEHQRSKSHNRQALGPNGLRAEHRRDFGGMFHSSLHQPFESEEAPAAAIEPAMADQHSARAIESGNGIFDAKVTVLGDYINHHVREGRRSALPKGRRTKMEAYLPAASVVHTPQQNHLLAMLDPVEHERLLSHLELVALPLGFVVCQAGSRMDYVYFPTTAIVSNFYELESGASAEISVTGNDGLVGIALITGGETTTSRAVVRNAGFAYRLDGETLKREFETDRVLRSVLLRYTQALITQMAQIAVCNCHHNVEQQLCRMLLFSLDRVQSNEIALTQELIASLLGVRRESVTEVAGKLQAAGLIRYNRGHIHVLDRGELEARVCECYAAVRSEFERLLPRPRQDDGLDDHFGVGLSFVASSPRRLFAHRIAAPACAARSRRA